jgi:hypothetical protein
MNWGMPVVQRSDECTTPASATNSGPAATCFPVDMPIGNALPDWQFSAATSLRWRRVSVRALLDAVLGRDVYNYGRHFSYVSFLSRDQDQAARTPETAKPLGYYWRAGPADGFPGVGGLYDQLGPNSHFVEDASFARLRELVAEVDLGRLGSGRWALALVARNLVTLTRYAGFDPETATLDDAFAAMDAYAFPQLRTLGMRITFGF